LAEVRAWKDTANRVSEESNKDYDDLHPDDQVDADSDRAQAIEVQDHYELISKEIKKELIDFFFGDFYLAEEEYGEIEAEVVAELGNKENHN
jgi:hypothetical protein